MRKHTNEQKRSHNPEQRAEVVEVLRVAIDPARPEEDLQVAEEMTNDEQDENKSRRRHDHLSANSRVMQGGDVRHER